MSSFLTEDTEANFVLKLNSKCFCGSGKKLGECCGTALTITDITSKHKNSTKTSTKLKHAGVPKAILALRDLPHSRVIELYQVGRTIRQARKDPTYWIDLIYELLKFREYDHALDCAEAFLAFNGKKDSAVVYAILISLAQHGLQLRLYNLIRDSWGNSLLSLKFVGLVAFISEDMKVTESTIQQIIKLSPDSFLASVFPLFAYSYATAEFSSLLHTAIQKFPDSVDLAEQLIGFSVQSSDFVTIANATWIDKITIEKNRRQVILPSVDLRERVLVAKLVRKLAGAFIAEDSETLERLVIQVLAFDENSSSCASLVRFAFSVSDGLCSCKTIEALIVKAHKFSDRSFALSSSFLATMAVNLHFSIDEPEKAIEAAARAREAEPDNFQHQQLYWRTLHKCGKSIEALEVAEQLLAAMEEPNIDIFNDLRMFCEYSGLIGKAQYYALQAFKFTPEDPELLDAIAFSYLLENNTAESLKYFELNTDSTKAKCFNARQQKLAKLFSFASKQLQSISYADDLIAYNTNAGYFLGDWGQLCEPYAKTAETLFRVIESNDTAAKTQVFFELKLQEHGDCSYLVRNIKKEVLCYEALPLAAQHAFVEAENLLAASTTKDYSSAIIAYSRAVEVFLRQTVFDSFIATVSDSTIRETYDLIKSDEGKKVTGLLYYITDQRGLQIGNMGHILKLLASYTALKVPLLAKLRDFIQDTPRLSEISDSTTIAAINDLALKYRNPAAHVGNFNSYQAKICREKSILILNALKFTKEKDVQSFQLRLKTQMAVNLAGKRQQSLNVFQ